MENKSRLWKIIHWLIILNFVLQVLYGFYMVFFIIGGTRYPLFRQAAGTPIEVILKRRLYAIETWIAMVGLALYLGVTEVIPRKFHIDREEGGFTFTFHWE